MMVDQRLVYTLVVIVVVVAFRLVLGGVFKRKLRELTGHHLLEMIGSGTISDRGTLSLARNLNSLLLG